MNNPIHILSLGAGVQSSCIALMATAGLITPMPEAAIFADTQSEPQDVYDYLKYLTPLLNLRRMNLNSKSARIDRIKFRWRKQRQFLKAKPVEVKNEKVRTLNETRNNF